MTGESAIDVEDLVFDWDRGAGLLSIPHFRLARGEQVFLHGPSGSGKSTFLSLLAGVLVASSGVVRVLGEDLAALRASRRDALRARDIGLIFQMFNLLPFLSVRDNVLMGCRLSSTRLARTRDRGGAVAEADRLMHALGLDPDRLRDVPVGHLSVGQQQRVAAARALIGKPAIVIADEPTSALDAAASRTFIELLLGEARDAGTSVLMVSHDMRLAPAFEREVPLARINRMVRA